MKTWIVTASAEVEAVTPDEAIDAVRDDLTLFNLDWAAQDASSDADDGNHGASHGDATEKQGETGNV